MKAISKLKVPLSRDLLQHKKSIGARKIMAGDDVYEELPLSARHNSYASFVIHHNIHDMPVRKKQIVDRIELQRCMTFLRKPRRSPAF